MSCMWQYLLQQLGVPTAEWCAVLSCTEGHREACTHVNVVFCKVELNIVVAASVVESARMLGFGCWPLYGNLPVAFDSRSLLGCALQQDAFLCVLLVQ